jgi:hypothetical protein
MSVVTMQTAQARSQRTLSAALKATLNPRSNATLRAPSNTLDELCGFLASFPIQMSSRECEALVAAAIGGHPEAEFMVGCVFDAADDPARAREWYFRSASHDYLPAMLQLFAVR